MCFNRTSTKRSWFNLGGSGQPEDKGRLSICHNPARTALHEGLVQKQIPSFVDLQNTGDLWLWLEEVFPDLFYTSEFESGQLFSEKSHLFSTVGYKTHMLGSLWINQKRRREQVNDHGSDKCYKSIFDSLVRFL